VFKTKLQSEYYKFLCLNPLLTIKKRNEIKNKIESLSDDEIIELLNKTEEKASSLNSSQILDIIKKLKEFKE
jgi:hypothetical protein